MDKPEFLNLPLPPGVKGVDEALDFLEDFGGPNIKHLKKKWGFKYWKLISFHYDLTNDVGLVTLKLLYSDAKRNYRILV